MEEKRCIRKRLIQVEKEKSDKDKLLAAQDKELKETHALNERLREENKKQKAEFDQWRKNFQSLLAKRNGNAFLNESILTPTINKENLIINDTLQMDDFDNSLNKSNLKRAMSDDETPAIKVDLANAKASKCEQTNSDDYLLEKFLNEEPKPNNKDIIELNFSKSEEIDSPSPKRRRNPFVYNEFQLPTVEDSINPYQDKAKPKMFKFKSFNELSLSQRFKESPNEIQIVKPITSNLKRPRLNLNDSSDIIDLSSKKSGGGSESKINAFTFLSDGLGGRVKHFNKTDKIMPLSVKLSKPAASSASSNKDKKSFLTKFKVSK